MKHFHAKGFPGAVDVFAILGLGLLVLVAVSYVSILRPQQMRLERLRAEAAQLKERSAQPMAQAAQTPADRVAAFYGAFPGSNLLPDLLDRIFAAAQGEGVRLDYGEYKVAKDGRAALTLYQVTFPVKGTYPQVRKFVAAALADVPSLSLESIKFERKKVGESTLDAKVRFVVYLGKTS
jgi:Tfp pilus assembly protein PilO